MFKNVIEFGGKTANLLSYTTDMAAYSFSLPAGPNGACPLALTGENTVCGSCYAMLGFYNMNNVMEAQYIRFGWVKQLLATSQGQDKLVQTLVAALKTHCENLYFRWFDSGDFFDPRMIVVAKRVCEATPDIRHWFPTRVWRATNENWLSPLRELAALPNVSVRPSALYFDSPHPTIAGLSTGTNVVTIMPDNTDDNPICPKTLHGGNCFTNSCRRCWHKTGTVSYFVHGAAGVSKPSNAMCETHTDYLTALFFFGEDVLRFPCIETVS